MKILARISAAFLALVVVAAIVGAATAPHSAHTHHAENAAMQMVDHPHGAVARAYWQQVCTQNPHQSDCVGVVNPNGTPGPDWNTP